MTRKFFNKDFLLLLQGGAVSTVGDVLYTTAISYSVLEQTGSTAAMSTISSIPMFATLFFMSFSGGIADKADRKTIIVGMDALRGVIMLVAGLLAVQGRLSVAAIFAVTIICSLAKVIFAPAVTVAYVDVIPADQLMRGQSLHTTVSNLSSLAGEAVSGGLINLIGVPFTIIFNGISFLFSAFTELFITLPKAEKQLQKQKATPFKDVGNGLKIIAVNPNLRIIIPMAIIINLLSAGCSRLILPLVLEKGMGIEQYGLIMSAASAGVMGCTAVLAARNFTPATRYKLMVGGVILYNLAYLMFCLSGSFTGMMVFHFLTYMGNGMLNAVIHSRMFAAMPRDSRGVISGIISSASTGACALSTVLYGILGDIFPLQAVFIASALLPIIPWLLQATNKNIKQLILNS